MNVSFTESGRSDSGSVKVVIAFDRAALRAVATPFGAILELEGCAPAGELGGPALPAKMVRVALPPGTAPKSARATALETSVVLKGPILPAPLQPARAAARQRKDDPVQMTFDDARPQEPPQPERMKLLRERLRDLPFADPFPAPAFEAPRQDLYARELEQPRPLAGLETTEELGLNPIAVVRLNPVRVTRTGQVEFVGRLELEVEYDRTVPTTSIPPVREPSDNGTQPHAAADQPVVPVAGGTQQLATRAQATRLTELARSLVVNPDWVIDISPWLPPLFLAVDYLIITDNFHWDGAAIARGAPLSGDLVSQFRRLADWKRRRGLRTHVATVGDIVAGAYGDFRTGARDLQGVLRSFLKHAHAHWGVAWVLLGGDIDVIPAREVVGYADGWLDMTASDPPEVHRAFWTGAFMKLRSPGHTAADPLLNAQNGLLIPFDATGASSATQRGWYFTTDETYATRSTTPTDFIRINGPAGEVNAPLQWVAYTNRVPTDLYYASLTGPTYGLPGLHDWDITDNGFYGTHNDSADMDGVKYQADVSVGRAPVVSESQAAAFVSKVIAYESFRRPDGTPLDDNWTRKMLIGSENWGGRVGIWPGAADPPGDHQAFHAAGGSHTLLNTKDPLPLADWRLLVQVGETDIRVSPYRRNASTAVRGWHYARSATDLSVSEVTISIFGVTFSFPVPTKWIVVFGPPEELTPQLYVFDHTQPDGSLADQETLRAQVAAELPQISNVYRLYQDEIDLTPAQLAAGPVEHLTEARMLLKVNEGQHFVSLSGHGWWGGCCGYGTNTSDNAANGFHAYIAYADSCLTNEFNVEDAISERSLYNPNGGAVAYIGSTRYSWIGVGDNFQRAFFHRLTSTRHLGLLADMRCNLLNEATGFWKRYNKWTIFALNLMGDPEMPVWVGPPRTLRARYARELDNRLPFEVRVSTRSVFGLEIPLSGAVVTVSQGAFYRQATTDAAGRVVFNISGMALGAAELTVTKVGYRPVLDTIEVVGPAWVRGLVTLVSHQHMASDSTYVRLALSTAVEGDTVRGWFARTTRADYVPILDAVTDAYVAEKPISLFVASIKEGGTIERFRLGELVPSLAGVRPAIPLEDLIDPRASAPISQAESPVAEPILALPGGLDRLSQNGSAGQPGDPVPVGGAAATAGGSDLS